MEQVDEIGRVTVVRTNGFSKVFNWRYQGRLSRSQFFCVTMAIFLSIAGLYQVLQSVFATGNRGLENYGFWILLAFGCLGFFFFMRACVLRLHDMGSSGGFVFLVFLFFGIFYLSMCLLSPSKGVNRFGELPVNTVLEKWLGLSALFLMGAGIVFAIVKNSIV